MQYQRLCSTGTATSVKCTVTWAGHESIMVLYYKLFYWTVKADEMLKYRRSTVIGHFNYRVNEQLHKYDYR